VEEVGEVWTQRWRRSVVPMVPVWRRSEAPALWRRSEVPAWRRSEAPTSWRRSEASAWRRS
jgi:hypothetical protein